MFRKIFIVTMFATAAGYCFAAENLPQVVTSEVFYVQGSNVDTSQQEQYTSNQFVNETQQVAQIPVWPIAGSEADVEVSCDGAICSKSKQNDNIRIVSKIGADLVVENNFNLKTFGDGGFGGWSGGANMLHGNQIPVGFDNECNNGSEMPLLHREMLEDDGGSVLAVSRSSRNTCTKYKDGYDAFNAKMGLTEEEVAMVNEEDDLFAGTASGVSASGEYMTESSETEISVDISADAEPPVVLMDQVRSWVVASGQTLREVLQNWCNKEGWDLVWATSREYPIEASAVFKGRFVDVASALVRNFSRATPVPYAKFYKGNRVLVISTSEE